MGYKQRREKLGKIITAKWVPKEPSHFLRARLPEGGAGLRALGQRGLEGQDLVGERPVKPTGFCLFPGTSGKPPTPLPTLPKGFLSWEV